MEKLIKNIKFIKTQYNTPTGAVFLILNASKLFALNTAPNMLHYFINDLLYTNMCKVLLQQSLSESNSYSIQTNRKEGYMLGSHSQYFSEKEKQTEHLIST